MIDVIYCKKEWTKNFFITNENISTQIVVDNENVLCSLIFWSDKKYFSNSTFLKQTGGPAKVH